MNVKKFAAAGVAGVASIALAMGAAGTAGAADGSLGSLTGGDNCGTTVVTPDATNGWFTPGDETPGVIKAIDNAKFGDGALSLGKDSAEKKGTSFYKKTSVALSTLEKGDELIPLSFWYTASEQAPALQLRIVGASTTGEDDHFATIVWSPGPSEGGWAEAKPAVSEQFWVTRDIVDGEKVLLKKGEKASLKSIIGMNPDASLVGYGVNKTNDNTSTGVAVDNFVFGCETTDFEPAPAGGPFGSFDIFGSLSGISSDS